MSQSVQDALDLAARLVVGALFPPPGIGKLTGFDGTVAYIASVGLPLPAVGAADARERTQAPRHIARGDRR